jgi:hypothetical protein
MANRTQSIFASHFLSLASEINRFVWEVFCFGWIPAGQSLTTRLQSRYQLAHREGNLMLFELWFGSLIADARVCHGILGLGYILYSNGVVLERRPHLSGIDSEFRPYP